MVFFSDELLGFVEGEFEGLFAIQQTPLFGEVDSWPSLNSREHDSLYYMDSTSQ